MRILLVEDHPSLREVTAEYLRGRGSIVDAFANAADALAAIEMVNYDIAILDLGLPDMDGMTLLRELQTRTGSAIPTLLATA